MSTEPTEKSANDNEKKAEITIDIDKSQDPKSFELSKSFLKEELNQAKDLILKLIEKSKQEKEEKEKENVKQKYHFHQHNTIAILGPRGVGKTSFLLSLKDIIEDEKVIWLPSVDPTRMETNEIFLVIIVANILRQIKIKKSSSGGLTQKVRDKLDSLSRDFTILAPSQVQEGQWKDLLGDPSSFAYELLNHAHSGLSLAQSFHEFLYECLKESQMAAFVQPIDDVDSAIEQGWPVLETLRKYLSTPYLITILSGDIRLYQSLVRRQQADKFSNLIQVRNMIKDEPKIMLQTSELVDQVSQLTDQYLAKLIPAYYRIHLTPLSAKVMKAAERGKEFLALQYNLSSKEEKFSQIYNKFRQDLFNIPRETECIEVLKKKSWLPMPLLPQATRSMIAFLKVIEPWSVHSEEEAVKEKISEEKAREKLEKKQDKAIEALAQVFNNSLYNGGIQTDDLLAIKSGKHLEWLAKYCLSAQEQFPDFWALEPLYDDEELNHRVLLLQAFLFHAWKSNNDDTVLLYPEGPISFAIKVCFPCWIASKYHFNKNNEDQDKKNKKYKDEMEEMALLMNVGIKNRHTYLAASGLLYTIKKSKEIDETDKKYRYALEVGTEKEQYIDLASRLFMLQPGTGSSSWISIVMGLARLADILREGPKNDQQLQNLISFLTEFGMTELSSTPEQPDNNTSVIHYKEKIRSTEEENLRGYLIAWAQVMHKNPTDSADRRLVTPLVISRTFRRFIRNLEFIDRDRDYRELLESGKLTLGKVLELRIVAFLNALLIEEVILKKGILSAKLDIRLITMKDQDNIFNKNNFENYIKENTIIPYTLAMLCCPLLLVFLANTLPLDKIKEVGIYKTVCEEAKATEAEYEIFLKKYSRKLHKAELQHKQKESASGQSGSKLS